MTTTRVIIRQWLNEALEGGARWVVVKRDWFDGQAYPVPLIRANEVLKSLKYEQGGDNAIEVYDLALSIDEQLAEERAWHPPEKEPVEELEREYTERVSEALAAQKALAEAADAYVWHPTPEAMEELRNARGAWQSAVGLERLAARRLDWNNEGGQPPNLRVVPIESLLDDHDYAVMAMADEDESVAHDEYGPLFIQRTPWKHRKIVWPGMPFHTLPFPYLFHRWDVVCHHVGADDHVTPIDGSKSYWVGFWRKSSAQKWIDEVNQERS